ncbi:MAG TPA: hypothetical protein VGW78_02505 [Candidatus Babeliales bacterium]|nr:hypothetical protein [Candidatus Babeliales bacterium]
MDIINAIPQDTITELSRQGVAALRADLRNNNPVRKMNIGCELMYSTYRNALDMSKQPLPAHEKQEYIDILQTYLNKCVEPHIAVYKEELQKADNTSEETRIFIKRIEKLSTIKDTIQIALTAQ